MVKQEDLNKYFDFTLTDEQREVVRQIMDFLDNDKEIFVLKGYAGTGKTSLVKGMLRYLAGPRQAVLLASTGRADKRAY